MLVKINKHGRGAGASPINYLLGAKRDRTGARVLEGNPFLTEKLIDATDYSQRYTSGTLSFEEAPERFTEEQKKDIMQKFESTIFAGLESDQYNVLWVEHVDKGRLELNFLIPNMELRSGKRLQPFYYVADKRRVNAFQNIINYEYKLTDPHDPAKKRTINPYATGSEKTPSPYNSKNKKLKDIDKSDELREEIYRRMNEEYEKNKERNARELALRGRKGVIKWLEEQEMTIERVTKTSISISSPNPSISRNIRLKGALFNERYITQFLMKEQQYDAIGVTELKYRVSLADYEKGMEIKKQYHAERFNTPAPPTMPLHDVLIGNEVSLDQNDIKTSEIANKQRQNTYRPF
mgnify:FL=1